MNWFEGDISQAIQKAIREKKVFLVFVKGDNEDSKALEDLWEDEEVAQTCSEDKCVSVSIVAESVSGQQFATIYPILCIPSTYLINCQGMPTDIIPGLMVKDEYVKRLSDGIQKTLDSSPVTNSNEENNDKNDTETIIQTELNKPQDDFQEEPIQQNSPEVASNKVELEADTTKPTETAKERAARLLEKSRAIQAAKEKEKEIEMERKRKEEGAELTRARRDMAERQARKLADEIAKQKAEEKAAREKVREQIRRDKAEKAERYAREKQAKQEALEKRKAEQIEVQAKAKERSESSSRIQFRLPDGSTSLKQFDADAKFLVVLNHAQQCVPDLENIRLTTVFPKHEYTNDDYMKSLRELKLVPSASIIVSRGANRGSGNSTSSSLNPISLIMAVIAPILAIFNWFISLFSSQTSSTQNTQHTNSSNISTQQTENNIDNSRNAAPLRRRVGNNVGGGSNIRQLRHDDDDDNEQGTWNGNSTQQM